MYATARAWLHKRMGRRSADPASRVSVSDNNPIETRSECRAEFALELVQGSFLFLCPINCSAIAAILELR